MKGPYIRAVALIVCVSVVVLVFSQFIQGNNHSRNANVAQSNANADPHPVSGGEAGAPPQPRTAPPPQSRGGGAPGGRPEAPDFIIPSDAELNQLDENMWMKIYWTYMNRLQVLCKDIIRVGSLKDGGKEICVDEPYLPKAPCIVYSFGINYQWDFDNDVVKKFGCQVFAFDPSMKNETQQVTDHIWFYKMGLGATNVVNSQGWHIHTLDEIKKSLGHTNRTIDILKIDVEGDEWVSLLQMISVGALDGVKQISMETHFSRTHFTSLRYWGNEKSSKPLIALRKLYEAGYRIFMRERNPWSFMNWPGMDGQIANVNEISLIKI